MRRYWIDATYKAIDAIVIEGDPFHHIFDVCRQKLGSQFEVLIGDGQTYLVEVQEIKKKKALTRILSQRTLPALPLPRLHLFLSVSKWPVMDAVVEKCVEMGVSSLQPVVCRNSFMKKLSEISPARIERWQKIVLNSTQQSGRGDLMAVHPACDLSGALGKLNQMPLRSCLFLYEGETALGLSNWHKGQLERQPQDVILFVGSEGGFTSEEVQQIQAVGISPVTIGPQVLRVETACVVGLSVLKYQYGLML